MSMMLELQKKLNQKLQQKLDSEKSQQNQGTSIKKESTQAPGLANESNEEKEARLQRLKESRRMLELKFSGQQADNTNTNEIQGQQDTTVTQNYNIQQSTVVISSSAPPPPPLGLDILDIPSFPLSQPIRTPYKQQQPQQQQQQQLLVSSSAPPPPPILDFTNPSIPPPPPISTLNNNNTQNTIFHPVFAETSIPPPPPAGLLDFKAAQAETNQVSSKPNKPQEVSEEQNNQVSTDQNKQEEQKEQSNSDIANNKHQSLNTDKDIPINFVESANIVDSQVNQVDASNVEVIFKTTNDQQKDQGDNKQQDNQKDNNNTNDNNPDNNVSAVPEQPSPGLKAHLRRTNKKTVGITSIGSIFGFALSKAQLNEELFPPSDMIQSHSPYSTFDKHSFNTINNQLRGDSEYPEQQVLYLSRQALVVEVLEGYVQNSSKNANRQLFRKNLQELIEKRVVENCTKASEASSKATKSLDLKLYEKAIASIQTAMQKMSQQNRFEECIQLRDAIKRIEELRTQIESTKENESRDSQIDFLNSELANIIMANHNKSGTSSTIHV